MEMQRFWTQVKEKLEIVMERTEEMFPYTTQNGRFVPKDKRREFVTWWTNSFWTGMLWLMHRETGKESYRKKAQRNEEALDECFIRYFQRLHHDVGFLWLLSAVANYRITGNEQSKMRGMRAASALASRYQIHGHFIRAWNGEEPGVSIIDTMMNLPLLYWASEVSGDPRFRYIAQEHTNMVLRSFVRSDGSVNHIVIFDTLTGEVKDTPGGQGYASGSSWSRGQAWALYGLALGYIHTKDEAYLEGAKRVAHYFLANIGPDGVPALDFRAPREPKYIDTTAGSIAASGLLEIEKLVPDGEKRSIPRRGGANFAGPVVTVRFFRGGGLHVTKWF